MNAEKLLEVCAFNIQSCLIAERAGAGRIELCADPLQGGTTPSYGLIQYALQHLAIPVFPMIRPRGGGFMYDKAEIVIMLADIAQCRQLGCRGIATGVVLADGRIDARQMTRIAEWAYPMQVTCHKAFDGVPDAGEALETLISCGIGRVLTSGLVKTAAEGAATLQGLVAQASGRIVVMPGGGVRSSSIAALARQTAATEYHSSGILVRGEQDVADEQEVARMVRELAVS